MTEFRYNDYDPKTRTFSKPMTEAEEREAAEHAMFAPIAAMFDRRDQRKKAVK